MANLFKLFFGVIGLTLLVGGGIFVAKNYKLIAANIHLPNLQNFLKKPTATPPGDALTSVPNDQSGTVLGVTKENITKTQHAIAGIITPITTQVGNVLGATVNTVTSGSTTDNGKVDVNKLFENAKSNAAAIPEQVFTQARYEYCKQVVNDFEKK